MMEALVVANNVSRISCVIAMMAVMISAIPAVADTGSRGQSPNYATVDVHLTYLNGSDADGMMVFLKRYDGVPPFGPYANPEGRGNYSFIVNSNSWGPMQLFAHDVNDTLWWFQELYVEPKGSYGIEGVIAPHLPSSIRIYGVVRNASSGSPIYNATIDASYIDDSLFASSNSTTSGTDGSYEVRVPASKHPMYLYIDAEGYIGETRYFYTTGGRSSYEVDLDLFPPLVGRTVPVNVRIINSTTGDYMMADYFGLSGTSSLFGHYRTSYSKWDPYPLTGHTTLHVEPGEYESSIRVNYPMDRINIESSGYLNIDEGPVILDVRLPVPELKRIDLMVRDVDGPIRNALVYFTHDFAEGTWPFSVHGNWETDADGEAYLMVPADTPIQINLYHPAHLAMSLPVDPRSDPNPLTITMEKDPGSEYPPHGNVSILVKDPITDVPIPSARLSGYGQIPGEDRMAHFLGDTGPDGYLNCSAESATYPSILVRCSLGTGEIVNLTVTEGSLTTRTVYLDRADYPPDPVEISFLIRDPEGIPLPDQYLFLTDEDLIDTVLSSDGMGMVRAYLEPGRYSMTTPDEFKYTANMGWNVQGVMPEEEIVVDSDGGMLPDVTMYLPRPLFPIDGMVRDALTGDPILEQEVSILSRHFLDDAPTRQIPYIMPYFSKDGEGDRPAVGLFREYGGSDHTGYYRLWGRESATITSWREGYYPYREEIEVTGPVPDHEIMLIPVPERNASVTGTLVDADGIPLSGSVAIVDPARDDYEIDGRIVNDSGEFSLLTYPGKVRAVFGNASLWDYLDIEVPLEGIEDLMLVLAPSTFINGTVTDPHGDHVAAIDLTLSGGWGLSVFDNVTIATNASGGFSFNAVRGIYRIDLAGSEEYEPLNVTGIECDGWTPETIDIVLEYLTEGYVSGRVIGSGGPFDGIGIPSAMVFIWPSQDFYSFENLTADEDGSFSFDMPFEIGTIYVLGATPPTLLSGKLGVRSGYLWNDTGNMTLKRYRTEFIIEIPYHEEPNMTWVNITEYIPIGEGVLLNEPIRINFTHRTKFFINDVSIDPFVQLAGLDFVGTSVVITHENFAPNTRYTFTFPGDVFSVEGYPLWNHTGITWSFTTGSTYWQLESADVYTFDALELHAEAHGEPNLTVFIVIDGVGSFRLNETDHGDYSTLVGGSHFGWNRYYTYHFSDSAGGEDLAPDLSGGFRTPFGGKPPQPPHNQIDNEIQPLECLACCGLCLVVIAVIVGVVLLLSRIKSRYDDSEE